MNSKEEAKHIKICNGCLHFLKNKLDCTICKLPDIKKMKCNFKEKEDKYENTAADDYLDYLHDQW